MSTPACSENDAVREEKEFSFDSSGFLAESSPPHPRIKGKLSGESKFKLHFVIKMTELG